MKYLYLWLCMALLVCAGCSDDDDGPAGRPGALLFRGFVDTEIHFYVGGEPADFSTIDATQLFNPYRRSLMSSAHYQGHYFYFDGDTVEIFSGNLPHLRYSYFFSGDSLFGMVYPMGLTGDPYPGYLMTGSKTELRRRQCTHYVRTYTETGLQRGLSFNVSDYDTPASMIGRYGFQGIEAMGPSDTLLLINQTQGYY